MSQGSSVLSCADVGLRVGGRRLLSGVSLQVPPGRCVALVGGNGVGKTTLLRTLLGEREPDEGTVSRPKNLRVGWLPQDVVDAVGGPVTVLEHVMEGAAHVTQLEEQLRSLEERMGDAGEQEQEQEALLATYARLQDRFEALGGYEVESEAHRVLAGLGFDPGDAHRDARELSGGWRVRVALARLLLSRPDLLVLDEPTNHLDVDTIAWLETTLRQLPGGLLVVSHDRDFIDATADVIVELAAGTATSYEVRSGTVAAEEGAFASFVAQREQRLASLRAARAQQDRQLAEQERFVERFRAKATKARQVQSRLKQLARLERIEVPEHRELVARFAFPEPRRSGRVVVELERLTVAYDGTPVFENADLVVERGRTVALIGPNGAGKTTLLRALVGQAPVTSGRVRLGTGVEVAVVDQHQAEVLDPARTVLEEFRTALSDRHRGLNHRTLLGAFGFPGELAERRVSELSGGERTRLGLAKAMASPANLLLLDEPTNHLDLASRDVLEDAVRAYPGTVLLITHDRHVIRATADAVVEVGGGGVRWFDGTYEELLERRSADPFGGRAGPPADASAARVGTADPSVVRSATRVGASDGLSAARGGTAADGQRLPADAGGEGSGPPGNRRPSAEVRRRAAEARNARYRATRELRRDVEQVERELGAVEADVAELTRRLADPAVYEEPDEVKALVQRHGQAKDRAAELLDRWEAAQLALERAEDEVDAG